MAWPKTQNSSLPLPPVSDIANSCVFWTNRCKFYHRCDEDELPMPVWPHQQTIPAVLGKVWEAPQMTGVLFWSRAFSRRHFPKDFLTVQINSICWGMQKGVRPPFSFFFFSRELRRSLCYLAPERVQYGWILLLWSRDSTLFLAQGRC